MSFEKMFPGSVCCGYCGEGVFNPNDENVSDPGFGVLCDDCYEEEVENLNLDEAYADHMNRMHDLRNHGVVVLDDHREK
tara:strand:+ start:288 stop:524 length:237 start_codon:yes stop_codon:yes gene_type:complete